MEVGLECYDADGNKIFDSDFLTSFFLGSGSTGTASGSLTDVNINNRKVWVAMKDHQVDDDIYWKPPVFSVSGNVIYWDYDYDAFLSRTIINIEFIYGVFL